jgi:hypothetical protein
MKGKTMRKMLITTFAAIILSTLTGCHSDIVCTARLKEIDTRCFHIEPLKTDDPQVGLVLKDLLEKEFVRQGCDMCQPDDATIIITGAAFLTQRSQADQNMFGSTAASSQAIESVTLAAKDSSGELVATASYDNAERFTAGRIGAEFGSAVAARLK